ncbi:MAG: hypothetical protein ACKVHJ_04790 [Flavobacteriales bacterium]|jgi:hypothetical protein|nr:hypothetical protein [Flavobacteriaceae bacterium]|tara:strand:+ start:110 stop:472 length:363 start_codon:yes stop_codon:yes gene_type:complete
MKLLYRIGFYLIGFSVGLVFLTFVLDKKKTEFNYGPSARVKSNLLKKKVQIPSKLLIENKTLTDSLIYFYIKNGTINFSKSETKKDSCNIYYIEITSDNKGFFKVANCEKTLNILSFKEL